jgi:hypothetical protein
MDTLDGVAAVPSRAPDPIVERAGHFGASDWVARATVGFVALGIVLRASRYLLNFPLWCDETMLAANFLDRGYSELLFQPLIYRQVGPVLFLLIELTAVKVLGFSEMTLRLFPALCAIASVPLFYHVAKRLLGGVPLLMAVGVFAVAGWPLRYAAEVKPYASDLFVALGLLALAVEWWRTPARVGWLRALAVAGPIAVALSLPAVFIVGGIGLALLVPVWRTGRRDARRDLILSGLGSAVTFLVLLRFYKTAPQDHDYFHSAWSAAFPPLGNAWRFLLWLLDVHTGFMFAYPDGGANGLSAVTTACMAAAVLVLWRRGPRARIMLATLLAPFGLALLAAAVHRYPYGVSARTTQYAAPTICLLTGLGAAAWLARLKSAESRRRGLVGVTIALAVLGFARLAADLHFPYKTASDERIRAFASWFWSELSRDGELACVHRDLGVDFDPEHWTRDATDTYLVYQKIYSPRHRMGKQLDLDAVSATRPLRCVLFNELPQNTAKFRTWLAEMTTRFDLKTITPFKVSSIEKRLGPTWDELYLVYEFVPKAVAPASSPLAGQPGTLAPRR